MAEDENGNETEPAAPPLNPIERARLEADMRDEKTPRDFDAIIIENPIADVLIQPKHWLGDVSMRHWLKQAITEALEGIRHGRWVGLESVLGQHEWGPGERLHYWRNIRGFSQRDLAAKSGVDLSYISKIENGKKTPGYRTALALAEALNCSHLNLL